MKDNTQTEIQKSGKPTHTVYSLKEVNGKTFWNKVGVAWEHADGEGLNQKLSLFDLDVTLTIRRNREEN